MSRLRLLQMTQRFNPKIGSNSEIQLAIMGFNFVQFIIFGVNGYGTASYSISREYIKIALFSWALISTFLLIFLRSEKNELDIKSIRKNIPLLILFSIVLTVTNLASLTESLSGDEIFYAGFSISKMLSIVGFFSTILFSSSPPNHTLQIVCGLIGLFLFFLFSITYRKMNATLISIFFIWATVFGWMWWYTKGGAFTRYTYPSQIFDFLFALPLGTSNYSFRLQYVFISSFLFLLIFLQLRNTFGYSMSLSLVATFASSLIPLVYLNRSMVDPVQFTFIFMIPVVLYSIGKIQPTFWIVGFLGVGSYFRVWLALPLIWIAIDLIRAEWIRNKRLVNPVTLGSLIILSGISPYFIFLIQNRENFPQINSLTLEIVVSQINSWLTAVLENYFVIISASFFLVGLGFAILKSSLKLRLFVLYYLFGLSWLLIVTIPAPLNQNIKYLYEFFTPYSLLGAVVTLISLSKIFNLVFKKISMTSEVRGIVGSIVSIIALILVVTAYPATEKNIMKDNSTFDSSPTRISVSYRYADAIRYVEKLKVQACLNVGTVYNSDHFILAGAEMKLYSASLVIQRKYESVLAERSDFWNPVNFRNILDSKATCIILGMARYDSNLLNELSEDDWSLTEFKDDRLGTSVYVAMK
jgi:hypothetical protein